MERVVFLEEATGNRISCLLNPQGLTLRRNAGVRRRRSIGGAASATGLGDDPLYFTGGGSTEMELKLLFDVTLAEAPAPATGPEPVRQDVRELTSALWRLSENAQQTGASARPPLVRFVWGKTWNIPGVVAQIAERLELFTEGGAPRRSWITMRFVRLDEGADASGAPSGGVPGQPLDSIPGLASPGGGRPDVVEILGGETGQGGGPDQGPCTSQRLDLLAHAYYRAPAAWKQLAAHNNVDNPLCLEPGTILELPQVMPDRAPDVSPDGLPGSPKEMYA